MGLMCDALFSLLIMNTDTPETDALLLTINEGRTYETEGPIEELARRLERERDHARAEAERWRDNWKNGRTMSMIVSTDLPWENVKG